MINYEKSEYGNEIYKNTNSGIYPLEDIAEELNRKQQILIRAAALLKTVGGRKINAGIVAEANDLVEEIKGEL